MKVQTSAQLNKLRIAPRKVRLVVDMVRGMNAQEAILQLIHSPKRAAKPVKKLIESAIANAKHNHHAKEETLMIHTAFVNEGQTLMRWMPRAFGRATKIRKRTSHITLVLEGEGDEATKKKVAAKKKEVKAEVKDDANSEDVKVEKKVSLPKKKGSSKAVAPQPVQSKAKRSSEQRRTP